MRAKLCWKLGLSADENKEKSELNVQAIVSQTGILIPRGGMHLDLDLSLSHITFSLNGSPHSRLLVVSMEKY